MELRLKLYIKIYWFLLDFIVVFEFRLLQVELHLFATSKGDSMNLLMMVSLWSVPWGWEFNACAICTTCVSKFLTFNSKYKYY